MDDDDISKSVFELTGQSPYMWLASAKQLMRVAELVRNELVQTLSVYPNGRAQQDDLVMFKHYMHLAGLALENLTKGILIGRNPKAVGPTALDLNSLVASKGGHDLLKLAQQATSDLSDDEVDLLKRLTEFVIWAGKYPIHLRASQTVQPSFITTDPHLVDRLFERLVSTLMTENRI